MSPSRASALDQRSEATVQSPPASVCQHADCIAVIKHMTTLRVSPCHYQSALCLVRRFQLPGHLVTGFSNARITLPVHRTLARFPSPVNRKHSALCTYVNTTHNHQFVPPVQRLAFRNSSALLRILLNILSKCVDGDVGTSACACHALN